MAMQEGHAMSFSRRQALAILGGAAVALHGCGPRADTGRAPGCPASMPH